jgi:TPR repeat protein/HEAT repeat protein
MQPKEDVMTARAPSLPAIGLSLALAASAAQDSIVALRAAAEKGDAASQYELARKYQYGQGIAKDDAEALRWLRRAAEGGSASAQHDLGFRYEQGDGVQEDPVEALRWYRRAVEKNHSGAQNNIGELYFEGKAGPKDCVEAAKWFRLAAAAEDARSRFHLGVLYATGCGVPQDDAEAVSWYRRAAEGWHDDAQRNLGFMYHAGRGVPRSAVEAARWFRRSWNGNRAALNLNGSDFLGGRHREQGAPRDIVVAHFWFSAALAEGDARVQRYLDETRRQMRPAQAAQAEELLREWQRMSERSLEDWVFLLGTPDPRDSDEAKKRVTDAGLAAVPALTSALRNASNGRRVHELSEAVRRLGPEAREAAPALEALLASRPPADIYRPFVVGALARVDPGRARPHIPELERCSLDSSYRAWVRIGCLIALDDLESESADTRIALLKDADADVRSMAARGLRAGPAGKVRGPLSAILRDPVLEVRVAAASSLLLAAPDAPAPALPALLEGLCKGSGFDSHLVAETLEKVPRPVALGAVDALTASLGGGDAKCRTWAAVALGRVDSQRAVPALGLLRKALASEDGPLRRAAAWTLALMGPRAREAQADLDLAARNDPDLVFARDKLKAPPPGLEGLRLHEVRLVGLGKRERANVAYLIHDSGNVFEVKVGQRLFDGVVEGVDSDGLEFRAEGAEASAKRTRVRLFPHGAPSPQAFDPTRHTGEPLSLDLEADVTSLVMLIAQFSGLNVVVEAGAEGRVRVAARNAPWDGVFERALTAGGFGYRVDGTHLRVGRRDRLERMRPLATREWSGAPVNFSFRNANLGDVLHLFAEISGLRLGVLPPEPYEPLTIFAQELPWDELLELIVASRGWTYRIESGRIRVEAPTAGR